MKKRDYSELGFLVIIFLYVMYYAFSVRGVNYKASLWPYILMIFTVVMIVSIGVDIWRGKKNVKKEEDKKEKISLKAFIKENRKVLVVITALLLYAILIDYLGYTICNLLFSFSISLYLGRNVKKAILVAVCITFVFWLGFDKLLGVNFPNLYLGF